jgi:hypothetical protein
MDAQEELPELACVIVSAQVTRPKAQSLQQDLTAKWPDINHRAWCMIVGPPARNIQICLPGKELCFYKLLSTYNGMMV